jgi:hypothetical protein
MRLWWVGLMARMGDTTDVGRCLAGKPLRERPLRKSRNIWVRAGVGIHVSCTTEVTFSWQRPGKCLFSQQRKERFHYNGGINCSIRCSLVGKPSSYERECICEQNTEDRRSTELRGAVQGSEARIEGTEQKWEANPKEQRFKTQTTVRDLVSRNSWICELL